MENKIYYLLIGLQLFFWNNPARAENLQHKYPDLVLSDDYGILDESDIIYDIHKLGRGAAIWQCFSINEVRYSYSTFVDVDPTGDTKEVNTFCDFTFSTKKREIQSFYYDRSARDIYSCRKRNKKWKKITTGQSHVCLSGSFRRVDGKRETWFWNKTKTKKGCDSLFEEYCNTKVKN